MTTAAWWASSWLMVLSMLIASAAFIIAHYHWGLVTRWLIAAVPVGASLIEHQWPMQHGGGTLMATSAYIIAMVLDYNLTYCRSNQR